MKNFKPMLAPNEQADLSTIKYPLLSSYKLDGIRCIFLKGKMLSRALKPIVNKQLQEKFEEIRQYSQDHQLILDGELYSPSLTFQEITRYVMTEDFEDERSVKKFGKVLEVPEDLKFYIFDSIIDDDLDVRFQIRQRKAESLKMYFPNLVEPVEHIFVSSRPEIERHFEVALAKGFEGLILRDASGKYKFGRGTLKEGLIYKVKPFITFDAVIKEVTQGTDVDPNAEKKINELGNSVTSTKKGDRVLVERVRDFVVDYEGKELKVSCSSLTMDERKEYWKIKDELIGKTIEYKGMLIGSKDLPRHPVFIRFREDK